MTGSKRRSMTYRLTAWIAGATTLILLLLGIVIGQAIERQFRTQSMALLTGKMTLVEHLLREPEGAHKNRNFSELLNDALIGHDGLGVEVWSAKGLLFRSEHSAFPEKRPPPSPADHLEVFTFQASNGRELQGIAIALGESSASGPYTVTITVDTSDHTAFMRSFSITLWSVVGLAALLTAISVWYIARWEMAPLKSIRAEAERITAQHLEYRLSTELVPQELVGLVETLNTMLARLEEAFQRLSDFSSDLAHELRTPVTNLLMHTQLSLSKVRTVEQYQDTLLSNTEELERLAHMISDILFLAKSDHELMIPNREEVDLRKEVDDLFEFYDALASEKMIQMSCTGAARIGGDRLMLRRALSNLMSNAVRHAPLGGNIQAQLSESTDSASISISNSGSDIASEHLPRLFDRFYRVDDSRQRFGEGTGLGLAITRSIMQAHEGKISVTSSGGFTHFLIELPKRPEVALFTGTNQKGH